MKPNGVDQWSHGYIYSLMLKAQSPMVGPIGGSQDYRPLPGAEVPEVKEGEAKSRSQGIQDVETVARARKGGRTLFWAAGVRGWLTGVREVM